MTVLRWTSLPVVRSILKDASLPAERMTAKRNCRVGSAVSAPVLLAVPLTVMVKIILDNVSFTQPIAGLMAED